MDKGTILITGASRGIGFHLAHRFLQEGYGVVGVSRTPAPIDNPDYHEFTVDLGDLDQVQALSSELAGLPIAGVINNAGIHGPVGAFENLPLDAWFKTFNVNLFGAAAMTQTCIPSLRRHNGFIIFLSGGGSAFPRPNYSAYGVSKCAVIRLADVLAKELSPQVLVYCIAPGPNRTVLLDETRENGEVVLEEDIVSFDYPENICLFLAKNRDPRYSGKFIHVRDDYQGWGDDQLAEEAYTLRRIDPRTLAKVNLV
jgi:NAD(P)-dependent dehydrogenase (short-subunit alcohol dehydrogenase family)